MLKYNTLGSRTTVQPPLFPPLSFAWHKCRRRNAPPLSTYVLQSDLLTLRERGVVPKKKGKQVFRRRSPSPPSLRPFFPALYLGHVVRKFPPGGREQVAPPSSLPPSLLAPPPPPDGGLGKKVDSPSRPWGGKKREGIGQLWRSYSVVQRFLFLHG